ncbi:hypothetical protein MNBD_GAMMA12-3272 [hydrothermal vent metagenome]|uniref:Uncharacterized protein n=1 Tax=hydrothermal vent metagenome TaxID=652676 RepID=A0A3B0YVY6_9ZZZZ
MCVFTREIDYVTSTRIFARIEHARQAIIYDMYLSTDVETAMVLPIPVAKNHADNAVDFIDLSHYEDIFIDINALFPKSRGPVAASVSPGGSLNVVQVGVFEASYVPTMGDFSRLDPRFRLNEDFFQKLPAYKDYGFVVFQLEPGKSQVHPMAFWFPTRHSDRLFFPTVHMHHGEVHKQDEYNHVLYGQGNILDRAGGAVTQKTVGGDKIKVVMTRSQGLVSSESEIYKYTLLGHLKNKDTWFQLKGE